MHVKIHGDTESDVEAALDQVKRSISDGNTSGFDKNESGRYHFEIFGEELTDKEDDGERMSN